MLNYWNIEITLNSADQNLIEHAAGICIALGAEGTLDTNQGLIAFLEGTKQEAETLKQLLSEQLNNICEISISSLENENWVQKHTPIFEPITCPPWQIIPFATLPEPLPELTNRQLGLIPGMGFGTGHHQSTRMALQLVAHPLITINAPIKGLDIGTGNGILAVALEKFFDATEIIATDIDPSALINAEETLLINGCRSIKLFEGSLPHGDKSQTQFDIITANLYAEVLIALQDSIYAYSTSKTWLIQAGILSIKSEQVKAAFQENWNLRHEQTDGEWTALLWARA